VIWCKGKSFIFSHAFVPANKVRVPFLIMRLPLEISFH